MPPASPGTGPGLPAVKGRRALIASGAPVALLAALRRVAVAAHLDLERVQ